MKPPSVLSLLFRWTALPTPWNIFMHTCVCHISLQKLWRDLYNIWNAGLPCRRLQWNSIRSWFSFINCFYSVLSTASIKVNSTSEEITICINGYTVQGPLSGCTQRSGQELLVDGQDTMCTMMKLAFADNTAWYNTRGTLKKCQYQKNMPLAWRSQMKVTTGQFGQMFEGHTCHLDFPSLYFPAPLCWIKSFSSCTHLIMSPVPHLAHSFGSQLQCPAFSGFSLFLELFLSL